VLIVNDKLPCKVPVYKHNEMCKVTHKTAILFVERTW